MIKKGLDFLKENIFIIIYIMNLKSNELKSYIQMVKYTLTTFVLKIKNSIFILVYTMYQSKTRRSQESVVLKAFMAIFGCSFISEITYEVC